MPDLADALFEDRHGTQIAIEVTAGAKTEAFPAGYNEWRKTIGCRVTAHALEGRANKAVMSLIAQKLKVPASTVSIHSGATSSLKKVLVTGISKKKLLAFLQRVEEDG
jgi:uncharacterized protein (TIGR00251 family)